MFGWIGKRHRIFLINIIRVSILHLMFVVFPKQQNVKSIFTPLVDGLKQDWSKDICWMNPPYGRQIGSWIKKAFEESLRGATVVCLVPSRTDTRWWWDYCMKGEIQYVKGRLKFRGKNKEGVYVNLNAPFANSVIIFRPS